MFDAVTKILSALFGSKQEKDVKKLRPVVEQVNEAYAGLQSLSNDELRRKTDTFRKQVEEHLKDIGDEIAAKRQQAGADEVEPEAKEKLYEAVDKLEEQRDEQLEEVLEALLPEAFAVMKEASRRFKENETLTVTATELDQTLAAEKDHITIKGDKAIYQNSWMAGGNRITWDMVPFDVQLMGGVVLHQGKIAEMKTGEGKTLVATLPAYLNGLTGMGVHIVTVNNYLAGRDAEWMGPLYEFLGLRVDCIDKYKPHSEARKKAYQADIIYGTNNEFGFDYLRDNMVRTPDEMVQRKLHFTMVDEIDSVLIDDARTPLIISGPVPTDHEQEFYALKPKVQKLYNAQRKLVTDLLNEAKKQVNAGKDGPKEGGLALLRIHRGLPKYTPFIKFTSQQGIKTIVQKTENHYLQDQAKEMPEVDKLLYFVIDEKNNSVELTEKGIDLITDEDQESDSFILPDVGSEMADLDNMDLSEEEKMQRKDKVLQDFAVKSERIHSIHQLLKAYTLFERDVDYVVMDGKVKIVDENTGRIMEGRRYSDGLHQAIEAKEQVKVEAASQTYATITLQNYFRMYHKLAGMTGTAETEAGEFWEIYKLDVVVVPTNEPLIRDDKQDLVYKTKREKYNAIIEEIKELRDAGRPILVGTTSVEVSEIISRMLKRGGIKHNVLNAKHHQREAEIIAEAGEAGNVTIATNMAGRGTDIKLGKGVKEAGGLAIIGSARHDARRIDRQLRGRAGRQGDPGSSQFFVSLEDDLMRLFGSERISKLMDRMGYEEGEVLQHSMITRSLERAQSKIEENNFGIRKKLLEYDDVMNAQRKVIYKKRRHALYGQRLSVDLHNMFYDLAEQLIQQYQEQIDYEGFKLRALRLFSIDPEINQEAFMKEKPEALSENLYEEVKAFYGRKVDRLAETAFPVIKDIHYNKGKTIEKIVVPYTDGRKAIQVIAGLQDAYETEARALVRDIEKTVLLAQIDEYWKNHLREMDELKQSVQSARYEQKDPLLIYKFEAFQLFQQMIAQLNEDTVSFLLKGNVGVRESDKVQEAREQPKSDVDSLKAGREDASGILDPQKEAARQKAAAAQAGQQPQKPEPVRAGKKVGRNEPCPCGSGKKYKHCHGR